MDDMLKNYRALVAKVDSLCREIELACGDRITCRRGCSDCCCHFSISWVEAVSVTLAVGKLDPLSAAAIRERAGAMKDGDACPLLQNGSCLLYDQRPIICRTHGLPIMYRNGGERVVDFCPRNFRDAEAVDGRHVIDVDRLNETIAAINGVFLESCFDGHPPGERLSIAEAILLEIEAWGDCG